MRREVRSLLDAHEPVDAREAASIARLRRELERLRDPFDRDADPVHVTGSAIVIGPRGVLLHVHRKLGIWMQPGGHLEAGERAADAAVRETVEETGVAVVHPPAGPRFVHADVHPAAAGHTHLDLRFLLLAARDDDPRPPPAESQAVRWVSWREAYELADESLRGALTTSHALALPAPDA
jgi:8-oxo-dGTP pyrophosphatase MutT (NUDIX family)